MAVALFGTIVVMTSSEVFKKDETNATSGTAEHTSCPKNVLGTSNQGEGTTQVAAIYPIVRIRRTREASDKELEPRAEGNVGGLATMSAVGLGAGSPELGRNSQYEVLRLHDPEINVVWGSGNGM
jgi:hypothetical protein